MSVQIPLQTIAGLVFFDLQAPLDGSTYTLEFRWNVRDAHWFLRVLDEQGENVLIGDQRVVANWPIAAYVTSRRPPGALLFIDSSGAGADPGLDDFTTGRHVLVYLTAAEIGLSA